MHDILNAMVKTNTPANLAALVAQFRKVNALVIGDAIIDRYSHGCVERICPEAPVPVFLPQCTEDRPGGAMNVVQQLANLGAAVHTSVAPIEERCIKHRYMQGSHLLMRVDHERRSIPSAKDYLRLYDMIGECNFNVIVLSDYGKGWLTKEMCDTAIKNARYMRIPVIVDPKGTDWDKYTGADMVCPNESEFEHWGEGTQTQPVFDFLAIKRGARGLELRSRMSGPGFNETEVYIAKARARRVYDVTGAGDTVVAVLAAAAAIDADLLHAAEIAVLAAGHVIGEIGTATVSHDQLIDIIKQESQQL